MNEFVPGKIGGSDCQVTAPGFRSSCAARQARLAGIKTGHNRLITCAGTCASDTRLGGSPGNGDPLSQGWHPEALTGFAGKQLSLSSLASIALDIHDVGPDLRGRLSRAASDGQPSHDDEDHELAPKEQLKQQTRAVRLRKDPLSSADSGDTSLSSVDPVTFDPEDTIFGNDGAGGDYGAARGADGTHFEENSNTGAGDLGSRLLSREQEESNIEAGGRRLPIREEELADQCATTRQVSAASSVSLGTVSRLVSPGRCPSSRLMRQEQPKLTDGVESVESLEDVRLFRYGNINDPNTVLWDAFHYDTE